MKKRIVTLLMACVLALGTSTTVLAAPSVIADNSKPESAPLEATVVEETKNVLSSTTMTVVEKKDYIVSLPTESLATSMKEDAALVEAVKAIEKEFTNIVAAPQVFTQLVKAEEVEFAGGILNAAEMGATTADLGMTEVPEQNKKEVPSNYTNAVQMDITLLLDGRPTAELKAPVAITMPAPTGVTVDESLVILHHHDGEVTRIKPAIGADGKITFAVGGFSTFVFANEVATDASYIYYLLANPFGTADVASTGNVVTAPKTGETVNVAAVMAVMAMAAGVVVIARRKETAK